MKAICLYHFRMTIEHFSCFLEAMDQEKEDRKMSLSDSMSVS